MTTILKEKYNINTSPHKGTFPHCYWTSHEVPLHGFEEIKCYLKISPLGGNEINGSTCAYLCLTNNSNFAGYVDLEFSISIGGIIHNGGKDRFGNNEQAACVFGQGRGWPTFCPSAEVLKKGGVEVGFKISEVKIVTVTTEKTVTITPQGECIHDYLPKDAVTAENSDQNEQTKEKSKVPVPVAPLAARRRKRKF